MGGIDSIIPTRVARWITRTCGFAVSTRSLIWRSLLLRKSLVSLLRHQER